MSVGFHALLASWHLTVRLCPPGALQVPHRPGSERTLSLPWMYPQLTSSQPQPPPQGLQVGGEPVSHFYSEYCGSLVLLSGCSF